MQIYTHAQNCLPTPYARAGNYTDAHTWVNQAFFKFDLLKWSLHLHIAHTQE